MGKFEFKVFGAIQSKQFSPDAEHLKSKEIHLSVGKIKIHYIQQLYIWLLISYYIDPWLFFYLIVHEIALNKTKNWSKLPEMFYLDHGGSLT